VLGRKVLLNKGAGFKLFLDSVAASIEQASGLEQAKEFVTPLNNALATLTETTQILTGELAQDPELSLANATVYLDLFGRVLASWIWLKQALIAAEKLGAQNGQASPLHETEDSFYRGKLQAARYYFQWELPEIYPQAELLQRFDRAPLDMQDSWF